MHTRFLKILPCVRGCFFISAHFLSPLKSTNKSINIIIRAENLEENFSFQTLSGSCHPRFFQSLGILSSLSISTLVSHMHLYTRHLIMTSRHNFKILFHLLPFVFQIARLYANAKR
jgi:hypothetical protein